MTGQRFCFEVLLFEDPFQLVRVIGSGSTSVQVEPSRTDTSGVKRMLRGRPEAISIRSPL